MVKKSGIVNFVFLSIIAILGILLCVCPFSVPYSSKNFNGFLGAINKSVDLDGGVSAIYNCTLPDGNNGNLTEAVDSSLSKIENIFGNEGFSQLFVERQGGNKVYILASSDAYEMNKAFYYMQDGKTISFTSAQVSDTLTSPEVYLNSKDLQSVKPDYSYDKGSYGITIEFTKYGLEKLVNLKNIASQTTNKTVYVYLGEMTSTNLLAEIPTGDINKKQTSYFVCASSNGSYKSTSADEVRQLAFSVAGGMLDVKMELVEVSTIEPLLGRNSLLYIGLAIAVSIFIIFALLIAKYRELGLVACLALAFYFVLFAFFMQAIPFITLTVSGVFGSMVAFIFATISIAIIYEKIKEEYALGKKIHLSCKGGFKKALFTVLDLHAIIALASIFIWVIAPSAMKCFAITMILGALISLFTSLVLLRGFVKNYVRINSTKAYKMGLYRDKSVKELKEDGSVINITSTEETEKNNEEVVNNSNIETTEEGEENLPNLEEVRND